ncbi:MAG: glycosyl hydrolase family 28-related protein [Terriglobales bacterium]
MKQSGTFWLAVLAIGGLALHASAAAQTVGGGGGSSGNATSIQSKPVAATAPSTNQVLTWNGSAWAPAGVATGSNAWSSILAPTANEAINHGNFLTTFTWGSATGAGADMLKLTDSSANTGTGAVLHVTTAVGSVAIPVKLDANGLGVELNASGVLVPIGGGHIDADQLQGNSVAATAPANNQVLTWNGSAWAPANAAGGSSAFSALTGGTNSSAAMLVGSGASLGPTGTGTVNANQLAGVTVSTTAPTSTQVLTYNGSQWAPAAPTGGSAGAFSGLSSGTNTSAAMLVGSGATLGPTGSGALTASGLQGCVNPFAYGAKGDDATDDTSAFQSAINALDAAKGGCLWIPPGFTFLIDGGLTFPTHGGTPGTTNGNQYTYSILGGGWSRTNNFGAAGAPNGGSVLDLRFSQMAAPAAPTVTPTTGTGSLPSGNYYVKVTYTDPKGETLASAETGPVNLSATGELTVTAPTFAADDESGWNVYISTATGTETKQNSSAEGVGTNYVQSAALTSGAALPGANTTLPPKIITLGYGSMDIERLALIDNGADCAPFVMTTATRLFVANDFFHGTTASNPGSSIFSCNDALILGGVSATQPGVGTSQDPYQGYGTVVRDNYFDAIRQGVLAQTYANSIVIAGNTWTPQSGAADQSHGAIAIVGTGPSSPDSGNYIAGNLIEDFAYPTAIYLENASNNDLIANAFWDNSSTTKQYVWCDSTDGHMNVVDGSANFSGSVTFYQSGSLCQDTTSRQAQSDVSTLPNGLTVGNTTFNGTVIFNGSPIGIDSNWALRTLTETGNYTLGLIDQIVLMNSSSATTATLPAAVNESGTTHCIAQIGTGGVTIAAGAGDTVNGGASIGLASQYSHVCVVSDGIHEWYAYSQ